MTSPWAVNAVDQLVIGGVSPPNIVEGNTIPPELVAWATPKGVVFNSLIIYYYSATTYVFEGVGSFGGVAMYVMGSYDPVNTVYILNRYVLPGAAGNVEQRVGSFSLNTFNLAQNVQQVTTSYGDNAPGQESIFALGGSVGWRVNAVEQERGAVISTGNVVDSAAVGAETVIMNFGSFTYVDGRAYRIQFFGLVRSQVTVNLATFKIRDTNVAGTQRYGNKQVQASAIGRSEAADFVTYVKNVTGANISRNLCVTLTSSANTCLMVAGGGLTPWGVEVTDLGINSGTTRYAYAFPLT